MIVAGHIQPFRRPHPSSIVYNQQFKYNRPTESHCNIGTGMMIIFVCQTAPKSKSYQYDEMHWRSGQFVLKSSHSIFNTVLAYAIMVFIYLIPTDKINKNCTLHWARARAPLSYVSSEHSTARSNCNQWPRRISLPLWVIIIWRVCDEYQFIRLCVSHFGMSNHTHAVPKWAMKWKRHMKYFLLRRNVPVVSSKFGFHFSYFK